MPVLKARQLLRGRGGAAGLPGWVGGWVGRRVHHRHGERYRLVCAELLLTDERAPGVEVDCVGDGAGHACARAAALAASGQERRMDHLEVADESLARSGGYVFDVA